MIWKNRIQPIPPEIGRVVRVADIEVVCASDRGGTGLRAEDRADLIGANGVWVFRDIANVARDDVRAIAGEGDAAKFVLLWRCQNGGDHDKGRYLP